MLPKKPPDVWATVLPVSLGLLPFLPLGLAIFQVFKIFTSPLAVWGISCFFVTLFLKKYLSGPSNLHINQGDSPRLHPYWVIGFVFLTVLAGLTLARSQLVSHHPDDPRRTYLLTGDEPAYLLLAHSLVFDGDLNVNNNHEDIYFFAEKSIRELRGFRFDYHNEKAKGRLKGREKEWENKQYFVNRPGLPILIAPAYALGFKTDLSLRFAVLTWLNVLGALLSVVLFLIAYSLSEKIFLSSALALFFSLSPPLLYYSNQIYPELPAALMLTGGLLGLMRAQNKWMVFFTGLVLAFLPWFHERYLGTWIILLIAGLFRPSFREKAWYWMVPVGISLLLLGRYYWFFYGLPFPLNSHKPMDFAAMPMGLLALFTDRDKGLLFINPLLVMGFWGLIKLWKKDRWLGATVSALLLVYLLPLSAFPDWHGGKCPPLRYLSSIIPVLIVPLVVLLKEAPGSFTRFAVLTFGAWGIWMGVKMMGNPKILFWEYGPLFEAKASQSAHPFFPGSYHPSNGNGLKSLLWLGLIFLFPSFDRLLENKASLGSALVWGPILLAWPWG